LNSLFQVAFLSTFLEWAVHNLRHGLGAARAAAHQELDVALVPLLLEQLREELFRGSVWFDSGLNFGENRNFLQDLSTFCRIVNLSRVAMSLSSLFSWSSVVNSCFI